MDRTRLQVIRADELLNRTMDRIEETTDVVHRTVVSPVRQLSGLIQGLTAGVEFLFGGKRVSRAGRHRSAGRNVYLVVGRQSSVVRKILPTFADRICLFRRDVLTTEDRRLTTAN